MRLASVAQAVDMAYEPVCEHNPPATSLKVQPAMDQYTRFLPGLSPVEGR